VTVPRLVIHLVLDDFGSEQHSKWGRNAALPGAPSMPFFDTMYDSGVRFEKHFAEGFCSPYRACMMTGRHTEDHGIGNLVESDAEQPLLLSEALIPEILRMYFGSRIDLACIGKWHLGNMAVGGLLSPNRAGFDYFFGTERNIDYSTAALVSQGDTVLPRGRYHPDIMCQAAITWLRRFAGRSGQSGYLYLPFHLPHDPFHRPPSGSYNAVTWNCPLALASPQNGAGIIPYYKAMTEASDFYMQQIWNSMPSRLQQETLILCSSDNGSDTRVLSNEIYPAGLGGVAYNGSHAKRSNFDPGIRTPAYAYSPNAGIVAAPGRSVTGLVQSLDWFATVLDVFGVPWQEIVGRRAPQSGISAIERSKSVAPNLAASLATTQRQYAITGIFAPNGYNRGMSPGLRCITDGTDKLLFPTNTNRFSVPSLYNIVNDPREANVEFEMVGVPTPARVMLQAAFNAFFNGLPPN